MKLKLFILLVAGLFFSNLLQAQDKIYVRNQKGFIKAKITEVGIDEIKYKEYDNLDGPNFTIEKDDIEKIEYQNGRVEKFDQSMAAKVPFKEMRKNNLKFAFISPLAGHLHLSYERGVKQGQAWEIHTSIIGAGIVKRNDWIYNNNTFINTPYPKRYFGLMFGGGYKFSFTPDYVMKGIRSRHFMQGSFIRPSAYFGMYGFRTTYMNNLTNAITIKKNFITTGAVMLEVGKQWILSNRASFEAYSGIGYGFANRPKRTIDNVTFSDYGAWQFLYMNAYLNEQTNSSIAFSLGLKFGYLFHTKKEKKAALGLK